MGRFNSNTTNVKHSKKSSSSSYVKYLNQKENAFKEIKELLSVSANSEAWKGYISVPAGSGLDDVLKSFEKETDIPLELPLFAYLHHVSGYLLKSGVTYGNKRIGLNKKPFIWNIVLADSGAGKTFAVNTIGDVAPVKSNLPSVVSGPAFYQSFRTRMESDGYCLWYQDECAQLLKQVMQPGHPLASLKDMLLQMYNGAPLTINSKKEGDMVMEDPSMSFIGTNTPESFLNAVSGESMTDGFAQRFGYCLAKPDPARPASDFPIYDMEALTSAISGSFDLITKLDIKGVNFDISDEAMLTYKIAFQSWFTSEVPTSFYRRNRWMAFVYSVLYHVMLGKNNAVIDKIDMTWALRLVQFQMYSMIEILKKDGFAELEQKVNQLIALAQKYKKAGKVLKVKNVQNNYGLTAIEAQRLMALSGIII